MTRPRLNSFLMVLAMLGSQNTALATVFPCETMFPKSLQTPSIPQCSLSHLSQLGGRAILGTVNFDNALLAKTIDNNNLGGLKINFKKNPKIVYRSAYLATSPLCIQQLTKHVSTVINLYSKHSGYADNLRPLEQNIFKKNGLNDYQWVQGFQFDDDLSTEQFNKKISDILTKIKKASGNVLIHCYVGEHDTGVIFALLNKCYNKQPQKIIEDNLKCHMDTSTAYGKNALAQINRLIKQYPCPE